MKLPKGFTVAGVHCGIKSDPAMEDLTLVRADSESVVAGVFTENIVRSASVIWNEELSPTDRFRGLIINSGIANACTGERGDKDSRDMAEMFANKIGCDVEQVFVMSTGVIGEYLPMDSIKAGVDSAYSKLGNSRAKIEAAANGMLTTDTYRKVVYSEQDNFQICGFAKGGGMIGPRMSTMLAIFLTDASLTTESAKEILKNAVDKSFNCISVEGHMSTSDSVLLVASGKEDPLVGQSLSQFEDQLTQSCIELAKMIPNDGEGASHLIEIGVSGCEDDAKAHQIAKTIANSALVKTAITGADPNWGRIVSAAGYAGVQFDVSKTSLSLNGIVVYQNGMPTSFDAEQIGKSLAENRETMIQLKVGDGKGVSTFWTSDLTVEYVKFNSEYHT